MRPNHLLSAMLAVCLFCPVVMAQGRSENFEHWLEEFRTEAVADGISAKIVEEALADVTAPLPRVVELDRQQPESVETLQEYLAARVSDERVANGGRMLRRYPTWLSRIEREFAVQRRFIVALWGMETAYGKISGGLPVVQSLATLAYEGRRGDYFRKELLEALRILDAGHIPLQRMKGSWAGAMGQVQFMPSSYRRFAVDADGNGDRDIWNSIPDALASAANYLAGAGWKDDQTWGRPVRLPEAFDTSLAGLGTRLPLPRWQALGVRRSDGSDLPRRELEASLIIPDGPDGPAYLVYDNFRALLRWNRSILFAVSVGILSDCIAAAP